MLAELMTYQPPPGYTAVIRIRRDLGAASRSAARRRCGTRQGNAVLAAGKDGNTLAALIRWYIDTFESISRWQRSKQTHLEFLERHPFSNSVALRLNVSQLVNHIKGRRAEARGPRQFATTEHIRIHQRRLSVRPAEMVAPTDGE